ncbi:MAG: hypothetical protein EBR09_06305 [Proteobacteria bacterium]|nr:hypothetical protein [Pseudomonadota bacterium]
MVILVKLKRALSGGIVKTLLTLRRFGGRAQVAALLSLLPAAFQLPARAEPPVQGATVPQSPTVDTSQSGTSGKSAPVKMVKIESRSYERITPSGSQMTWIIQNTLYDDGTRVITPAGVQFENSFGLSVVVLDEVSPRETPAPAEMTQIKPAATQGGQLPSALLEDKPELPVATFSAEVPEFNLQLRSLLIDLKDLSSEDPAKPAVPSCDKGRRRAVAFLRAEQLGRELQLEKSEAEKWSRYGRAACVQWNTLPQLPVTKTAVRTSAPSRQDAPSPKD